MKICLYGSGSSKIDDCYKEVGYKLGETIAKKGHSMVFGAGSNGMMGSTSRGVCDNNGKVLGICPEWINEFETISSDFEVIYTKSMDERKNLFLEKSDAFIVVPGGLGTLDELFEVLTLKKLKRHSKPVVIFNINHFYDTMVEMLNQMVEENVIPDDSIYKVTTTVEESISYLEKEV